MRKVIHGIPKKTIEYMLQLFSPTMDDYPYVLDLKDDSYLISSTAVQRFRLPADHFSNSREVHRQFVYPEDLPALWEDLDRIRSGEKSDHNMDYRWLDRHGDPVWINCRGLVLYEQDGSPRYLIGCINEIGKKQKADNVSGLLGAGGLWQYAQEFPAFLPDGFVIRLGMDDLGVVNSSFGMNFGDYLLKETADCIQRVMEPEQRLFRLVSDQFIIADLSGRSIRDAKQLYERIRTEISSWVEAHQYQILFTVSTGIIGTGGRANDYDQLLKYLEFALNQAKRAGKNESYVFAEQDYEAWRRRQRLAKQLLYAVNNGYEGFEVYYQPVMNAPEHHLVSAEALMRFFIPAEAVSPHDSSEKEQRMVSPAEFIPILEESGLIIPAGRWLLHKAAADCKKWQKDCPGMRVQVNVSYVQVAKANVLREVREALEESGLPAECMGVELTESGYLDPGGHFRKVWQGLKALGVKVLLDDFGTRYSNFHCLGDLTPNGLKIDRSFTRKALADSYEFNLLAQMIQMSKRLGIYVCIEGIETQEELERILMLEPDRIQGYYFSRPLPEELFRKKFIRQKEMSGNA